MFNIWRELKKPIWCLAPMFGVTDSAFRQMLVEIGKPDLMFTEFTNVQQFFSPETKAIINQLSYFPSEQPLICQLWGLDPELFEAAADLIVSLGFKGIDINFGCSEKAVIKKGSGAALIDNPDLAGRIIQAVIKGSAGRLPVSVKTRLGNKGIATESWFKFLLQFNLAAISVHCRTAKEMFVAPVHYQELIKIVRLKNNLNPQTLIIANGNIFSRETALQLIQQYQLDGVMIGRGVLKNPWIFNPDSSQNHSSAEKISAWQRHLQIYRQTWSDFKPIHPMKRFIKIYLRGFKGALKLRTKIMNSL